MRSRLSVPALLAVVLWGATAFFSFSHAQGDIRDSGKSLTDDTLNEMLNGLGYEPKKLTRGYLLSITKDAWTYNMQLVLSKDSSRLGMNANLGQIDQPDEITASQWKDLLIENGNVDPSFFYFDKDQKKLYLHRVLDNRAITPAYLRQQVENFCSNIKDTADKWKFTK